MLVKITQLKWILYVLILSFLILSLYIYKHPVTEIDIAVSTTIQKYHSDAMDQMMKSISIFGEMPFSLIFVLLAAGTFYFTKFRIEAYFTSLVVFSGLLILLVKNIINRPRPTGFYVRLVEIYRLQSFPSGHVLSYVLFFGFMIVLMLTLKEINRAVKIIVTTVSVFLILAVPASRIYLGAHWFTDTVGGFILGIICLFPLCFFYFKQKEKLKKLEANESKNQFPARH